MFSQQYFSFYVRREHSPGRANAHDAQLHVEVRCIAGISAPETPTPKP
jgi:hypothetical protein